MYSFRVLKSFSMFFCLILLAGSSIGIQFINLDNLNNLFIEGLCAVGLTVLFFLILKTTWVCVFDLHKSPWINKHFYCQHTVDYNNYDVFLSPNGSTSYFKNGQRHNTEHFAFFDVKNSILEYWFEGQQLHVKSKEEFFEKVEQLKLSKTIKSF